MLGRKATIGGLLTVAARLISRVFDLLTLIILARVLGPTDFGVVAIAVGIVSVVEAATEMPVMQVLVRLPDTTAAQFDTAFTLSLLRGLVLTAALALAAWPIASFYGDNRLAYLICTISIAPAARGLLSPKMAIFQHELSFWRDFVLEFGGKVLASAAAIAIALYTHSYWAIAIGVTSFPLAWTIGSYCFAPYRPRLGLRELDLFKGFVGWLSLAQLVTALNWQTERLLIGKFMLPSQVGLFSTSTDMASIPFFAFFGPVLRPLLAAFSRLDGDKHRLGASYLVASSGIFALGLPVLVGESLVADPAVRVVLGTQWLAAIPLVRWLALSLVTALLALPAVPLLLSAGRTRSVAVRNALEFGVKLPISLYGILAWGYTGAIAARFVSELAVGIFCMIAVRELTGLSVLRQLSVLSRSVLSTALMVPAVLAVTNLTGSEGQDPRLALALAAGAGATVYTCAMFALWRFQGRPAGPESMVIGIARPYVLRAGALVQRLRPSLRAKTLGQEGGHV